MSIDEQALRAGLDRERRELRDEIAEAELQLQTGDDEMVRAGLELQRSQLRTVEHALERHRDGSWRQCEECGEAITDAQVAALPTVTHCPDCAESQVFWGDTQTLSPQELGLGS